MNRSQFRDNNNCAEVPLVTERGNIQGEVTLKIIFFNSMILAGGIALYERSANASQDTERRSELGDNNDWVEVPVVTEGSTIHGELKVKH